MQQSSSDMCGVYINTAIYDMFEEQRPRKSVGVV